MPRGLNWPGHLLRRAMPRASGRLKGRVVDARRIVVFAHRPSPTYDYYLAGRLADDGLPEAIVCDPRNASDPMPPADGSFVIICRYASRSIVRWIKENSHALAGVAFLIDDDVAAVLTGREATLSYRSRLLRQSLLPMVSLRHELDVIWASTDHLCQVLGGARRGVETLPPAPSFSMWERPTPDGAPSACSRLTLAYHGTAIHVEEHRFLAPMIRDILAMRPQAGFEIFCSPKTERFWQQIEGVVLRQALDWDEYREDARSRRIDIMLVPLAASSVNESRSGTKRIDVARYGAAAIFSASNAYGRSDGSGEILLPNDADIWRRHVLELIDDGDFREKVAQATLEKVGSMSLRTPGLFGSITLRNVQV